MQRFLTTFLVFGTTAFLMAAEPDRKVPNNTASPYGVCSHLQGGEEHRQMPENLRLMKAAGIDWVRADFAWGGVEPQEGQWRFDHLDRVVDEVEKAGMTVLPILDYDVPRATPAYKHLDKWTAYVDKLVRRYKDRIRYWEVWNEQNLEGFWREKPDAENYQLLLEATYKTIKAIDPDLQVVYGGLAGIPFEYIEDSLKAGAAEYFDVFNIHPYRGGMTTFQATQGYIDELVRLRKLLDEHGAAGKPVWITEFGWATPPAESQIHLGVVRAAREILARKSGDGKTPWKIAVLYDPRYATSVQPSRDAFLKMIPENCEADFIILGDLKTLDPKKHDALLLPPGELCPTPFFGDITTYVKNGGTLFLLGGVPLYYDSDWQDNRLVQKGGAPDAHRNALRIGWTAWWHKDSKAPKEAPLSVAEGVASSFEGLKIKGKGERFLDDTKIKQGDRFIPLLTAKSGDFEGVCAAVYDFNSEFKGAVVVSAIMGQNVATTEADQAVFLPQAILLSLHNGIERYFWYEFQSMERDDQDKEHHFGIVHQQLDPKPAYLAYKALTKARPAGSVPTMAKNAPTGVCEYRWKRPDGREGHALWCLGVLPASVDFSRSDNLFEEIFDHLGSPVKPVDGKIEIGPEVIYLIKKK